ncbi:dTDP-4-dehydrorhamnose 3,5-epimerase family protein [Pseudomonas protegens]|uniref:dTDP-4-dehydrorhamnose 3,5-epimerase family protein n=1 Tax=Pseudomonas protegens TaxID=380021 RepID=UPI00382F1D9C
MKATRVSITDLSLLEPKMFGDERGFLHKSFRLHQCEEGVGNPVTFMWRNHSHSLKKLCQLACIIRSSNLENI